MRLEYSWRFHIYGTFPYIIATFNAFANNLLLLTTFHDSMDLSNCLVRGSTCFERLLFSFHLSYCSLFILVDPLYNFSSLINYPYPQFCATTISNFLLILFFFFKETCMRLSQSYLSRKFSHTFSVTSKRLWIIAEMPKFPMFDK